MSAIDFTKKYKHGVTIMKAMPFHLGHVHMILEGAKHCEKFTVMVYTRPSEPMNWYYRGQAVKDYFNRMGYTNINVIRPYDQHSVAPQSPQDHPFHWEYWSNQIKKDIKREQDLNLRKSNNENTGEFDLFVSSEDYGRELSERSNGEFDWYIVDQSRNNVPVSATKIRENPAEYWKYLPFESRHLMMKKFILCGVESTGKTVMAKRLSKEFGIPYVEEFGRVVFDNVLKQNKPFTYEHIGSIIELYEYEIMDLTERMDDSPFVIVDTDPLMTEFWSYKYFGKFDYQNSVVKNSGSFYLLLDSSVPWVDDGTRQYQHDREVDTNKIAQILNFYNKPYGLIRGENYEDRYQEAKDAIKIMMGKE